MPVFSTRLDRRGEHPLAVMLFPDPRDREERKAYVRSHTTGPEIPVELAKEIRSSIPFGPGYRFPTSLPVDPRLRCFAGRLAGLFLLALMKDSQCRHVDRTADDEHVVLTRYFPKNSDHVLQAWHEFKAVSHLWLSLIWCTARPNEMTRRDNTTQWRDCLYLAKCIREATDEKEILDPATAWRDKDKWEEFAQDVHGKGFARTRGEVLMMPAFADIFNRWMLEVPSPKQAPSPRTAETEAAIGSPPKERAVEKSVQRTTQKHAGESKPEHHTTAKRMADEALLIAAISKVIEEAQAAPAPEEKRRPRPKSLIDKAAVIEERDLHGPLTKSDRTIIWKRVAVRLNTDPNKYFSGSPYPYRLGESNTDIESVLTTIRRLRKESKIPQRLTETEN